MSNLDVALRIKLLANTGPGRKRAISDLQGIKKAADSIGKGRGGGNLEAGLDKVERKARRTRKAVAEVGDTAGRVKRVDPSTNMVKGFDAIERKARQTRRVIDNVSRAGAGTNSQVRTTGGAFDFLAGTAGRAFTALAAFAAPLAIIRGLSDIEEKLTAVERRYASIAVTAEQRDPAYVAKMRAKDTEVGKRYGLRPEDILPIRNDYAAAGIDPTAAEKLIDPSSRAMKAMDASPGNISQTVISGIQNLGITPEQIPLYLDMIAKGTKLGRFEADSVAKFMPTFASNYASLGYTGLDAAAEINAMAQVVRMTAPSADAAGTNLQNYLMKLTAPDSVKNFKEKGVDIEAIMKKSRANGTSFVADALAKTWEVTKGDTFSIGELFGDMQAKQALEPLLRNRELLEQWKKIIREESGGTLDEDWKFLRATPAERQARYEAVAGQGSDKVAQSTQPAITFWKWLKAELLNPGEAARQDRLDTYTSEQKAGLEARIQKLEAERSQIFNQMEAAAQPDPLTGMVGGLGGGEPLGPLQDRLGSINDELQQLKGDLDALRTIGEGVGNALDQGLKATAPKSIDTMNGIVNQLKSIGDVTISPTVIPRMGGPLPATPGGVNVAPMSVKPSGSAPPPATTLKRGAALGGGQTNHFHIGSTDPKAAANEIERKLARLGNSAGLLVDTA
ncbi:phage tail tape measure protein [Kaistia sp. MMO-174]|uniref:phage tail tape measure protein n=1 Tax=Kaistia sp. MMO-174 TaxID=3081256 RepID=UPI00301A7A0D